ncbi:Antitoxin [Sphingomonas sp. EC-HK361]|uniref:type II toxin-antitoxin system Phd/YefM family antitoxin n=1 Tax=Sphingomonas sp. EC-HK361 TaxID=2038397 RepID=UPI0012577564|nr:type II toxin-antitoxin system prevent-host-death family antitoxin [Sphingomonas sp. EC-HK361]VVT06115.1 Antitoxin [Sphingomonas sp. EC-HK361]
MTIHVNIGEAKTRLSELVAAAVRGEDVVLAKAGEPQVRLIPVSGIEASQQARERIATGRRAAIGMWRHKFQTMPQFDIRSMTMSDAEWEEHYRKKFGDPA